MKDKARDDAASLGGLFRMKLLHHERKGNNCPLGAHIGEEKQHQCDEKDSGIHLSYPVSCNSSNNG
jgi:hypothetical protein